MKIKCSSCGSEFNVGLVDAYGFRIYCPLCHELLHRDGTVNRGWSKRTRNIVWGIAILFVAPVILFMVLLFLSLLSMLGSGGYSETILTRATLIWVL